MENEKHILDAMYLKKKALKSEPKDIYLEENSRLIKLKGVKIIWSNFRNSYKLIDEKEDPK